jgi:hypothetical protein
METAMTVAKRKFEATVYFGDERQSRVYAFHTQAELDAFLRGVDDAIGWDDYDVDNDTFNEYTLTSNPHRLNEVRGGIIYDEYTDAIQKHELVEVVRPYFQRRPTRIKIDNRLYRSLDGALAAAKHFANVSQQPIGIWELENYTWKLGYAPKN